MFQEMYGDADLDRATLRLVKGRLEEQTSTERKVEYKSFMEKVREIQKVEEQKALHAVAK